MPNTLFDANQTACYSQPFTVSASPQIVRGFNLDPMAEVFFEMVLMRQDLPHPSNCMPAAADPVVAASVPYMLCCCEPAITPCNPVVVLDMPGTYRAVYAGPGIAASVVRREDFAGKYLTDAMRGLCC